MVAESDKTVPTRSISFQVVINKSKHSRIAWLTGLSAYCKSYTLCGNLLGGTKLKQREWWPSFSMWCIAYPNPLFYTNSKQQHLQCKYLCPFPPGWYVLFHPPPGCPSSLPHSIPSLAPSLALVFLRGAVWPLLYSGVFTVEDYYTSVKTNGVLYSSFLHAQFPSKFICSGNTPIAVSL